MLILVNLYLFLTNQRLQRPSLPLPLLSLLQPWCYFKIYPQTQTCSQIELPSQRLNLRPAITCPVQSLFLHLLLCNLFQCSVLIVNYEIILHLSSYYWKCFTVRNFGCFGQLNEMKHFLNLNPSLFSQFQDPFQSRLTFKETWMPPRRKFGPIFSLVTLS